MVEQAPVPKKRKQLEDKDIADFFKRHRLARYPANITWRIAVYIAVVATPSGRDVLRKPETRRILFDREARVGLLEDSIFNNELFYPNRDETSLAHKSAVAGRYVGYDFNRPAEFGPKVKKRGTQLVEDGRLFMAPLNEIVENSPDKHTSTYLLNIFNIEHFALLQPANIDDLLGYGLLEQTTYREAYDRVGLYNKYKASLALGDIADRSVYRVTPKGNSLVMLERDFGEQRKLPDTKKVLKPAFAW